MAQSLPRILQRRSTSLGLISNPESDEQEQIPQLNRGDKLVLKRHLKDAYWRVELNGTKLKAKCYIEFFADKSDSPTISPRVTTQANKTSVTDLMKMAVSPFLKYAKSDEFKEKAKSFENHPIPIPEITKKFLRSEIDILKNELSSLMTDFILITKSYNQEYGINQKNESEECLGNLIKPKPHDVMFMKMLENPYKQEKPVLMLGEDSNDKKEAVENEEESEEPVHNDSDDVDDNEDEQKQSGDVVVEKKTEDKKEKTGLKSKLLKFRKHKDSNSNESKAITTINGNQEIGALVPARKFRYVTLLWPIVNPGAVPDNVVEQLQTLDFDVLPFKNKGEEDFPCLLVMHMFHKLGLVTKFNISHVTLFRFVKTLSYKYRYVPFHNFFHAFNVTQTLYFFLTSCGAGNVLTPLEKLSLMIAALCHDCDHPGLNNSFQAKATTRISSLHKKSTLENHHLLQCMFILSQPECNILANISEKKKSKIFGYIKHLILATDLALHGIIHRRLADRRRQIVKTIRNQEVLDEEDKILLMCTLMKCSDLSNEIRQTQISQQWAKMVLTEFFKQSDKERELALPVTPFMDKHKIIIAKEQINFIENLCLPLYENIVVVFPPIEQCIKQMNINRNEWLQRLQNFFSNDPGSLKKLSNISIWERDQVKGKKWDKLNLKSLLSSRSSAK